MSMSREWDFFGLSDIGLSRPNNQDVWSAHPDVGFFGLADGMGGRKGGEVAAKEALASLYAFIKAKEKVSPLSALAAAIERANERIYNMGREQKEFFGMGTTLCCLLFEQEKVYYAHVGDSRIYRLRDQKLELLTQDHSLLAKWAFKKKPHAPLEEAIALALLEENQKPPPKHIITKAIGPCKSVEPEISSCEALPSDLFLLCSDGLSDLVPTANLQKILQNAPNLEIAAQRMIECAKFKGSNDNITVLLAKYK